MNSNKISAFPLQTIGLNKLTKVSIHDMKSPLLWSNKHVCPEGYTFNEEGWVETTIPFPKISAIPLIFLSKNKWRREQYLLHNLLALRFLNNKPHDLLLSVLLARDKRLGIEYEKEEVTWVVKESLAINSLKEFPVMDRSIYRWDTLWSDSLGRPQINRRRISHFISDVRDDMPIHDKYKSLPVKITAKVSLYAVRLYWKEMGWSATDRTKKAILEALAEDNCATQREISIVSGVSERTIRKYLPK